MDDILFKSLLFDFYGNLLTDRQRSCFEMYYFENLTLSEIGADFGVTLQAAGDIIRRTEKNLLDYESKLGIVAKYENQQQIVKDLYDALDHLSFDENEFLSKIEAVKADIQRLLL